MSAKLRDANKALQSYGVNGTQFLNALDIPGKSVVLNAYTDHGFIEYHAYYTLSSQTIGVLRLQFLRLDDIKPKQRALILEVTESRTRGPKTENPTILFFEPIRNLLDLAIETPAITEMHVFCPQLRGLFYSLNNGEEAYYV